MAGWHELRRYTPARVALGVAGHGLPTDAHLAFQSAHAAARDAVHTELDPERLRESLPGPSWIVRSACPDRRSYLMRPDLGRQLDPGAVLPVLAAAPSLVIVVCDGLSAVAVQRHAGVLIAAMWEHLAAPPIIVARQGRVALGDAIGAALGAEAVLVLIGERPGLSAPDSLGAYLTWRPHIGCNDSERNCVSNIRPAGLAIDLAARKLLWLIGQMRRVRLTGVQLKDEEEAGLLPASVDRSSKADALPS